MDIGSEPKAKKRVVHRDNIEILTDHLLKKIQSAVMHHKGPGGTDGRRPATTKLSKKACDQIRQLMFTRLTTLVQVIKTATELEKRKIVSVKAVLFAVSDPRRFQHEPLLMTRCTSRPSRLSIRGRTSLQKPNEIFPDEKTSFCFFVPHSSVKRLFLELYGSEGKISADALVLFQYAMEHALIQLFRQIPATVKVIEPDTIQATIEMSS